MTPQSLDTRHAVCEARLRLVEALTGQQRNDEAQRELETLLPECERLTAGLPNDWLVACTAGETAAELAEIHAKFGRLEEAAAAHERARQAYASIVAHWPKATDVHVDGQIRWCTSTCALADVLGHIAARQKEAEPLYREVLAATEPLMVQRSPIGNLSHVRVWAQSRLGDWPAAVRELGAYSRAAPNDFNTRYRHAIACLAAGDREAYRAVCRDALEHLDLATQSNGGPRMVWACLLVPDSGIDPAALATKAEALLAADSRDSNVLLARSLLHYRAGRYEQVLGEDDGYVAAMAHQQLGHAEEARRRLALANEPGDRAATGWPPPWDQPVWTRLLRQEAEELIVGPASRPSTSSSASSASCYTSNIYDRRKYTHATCASSNNM